MASGIKWRCNTRPVFVLATYKEYTWWIKEAYSFATYSTEGKGYCITIFKKEYSDEHGWKENRLCTRFAKNLKCVAHIVHAERENIDRARKEDSRPLNKG